MNLRKALGDLHLIVELFALSNLAFLALDIYVAHSMNAFRHAAEWIPFVFSLVASVALVVGLLLPATGHPQSRPGAAPADSGSRATIDTVIILRQDLFSDEDEAGNAFFRFFNNLHATTRPFVIERELLLGGRNG